MKSMTMTTRLSALAGAVAMTAGLAVAASPAQSATREGGGIAWDAPTCELAVRNGTDGPISMLVESDIHEHPGMILGSHQEPLVEYDGDYTRSKLLGRVADMPDDSGTLEIPAGKVASFAIPCAYGATPAYTIAWASDADGEPVKHWDNVHWKGHPHSPEGHVLMDLD